MQHMTRVVADAGMTEQWDGASPASLEIVACERNRVDLDKCHKRFLFWVMKQYPEVPSRLWRTQLTSAMWMHALFGASMDKSSSQICSPSGDDFVGIFVQQRSFHGSNANMGAVKAYGR